MVTLLLIDDEYLLRRGICETIEWAEYGIEIIGTSANGVQGLEMAIKHKPDIIITDIRMPLMNGLEFMIKVKESGLTPKIVVLSGFDDFEYARTAMHNGAVAYILKPVDNDQLVETVRSIAKGIINEKNTQEYFKKLKHNSFKERIN